MRKFGVYQLRNTKTNRIYIGSTKDFSSRKSSHFTLLRKSLHYNTELQNDFVKYGSEAFEFSILEEVLDLSNLKEREQHWLDSLRQKNKNLYNILVKTGSAIGITVVQPSFCLFCNSKIEIRARTVNGVYPVCSNCYQKHYRTSSNFTQKNRVYSQTYYSKHKMKIKIRREEGSEEKYRDRLGHIRMIYSAVKRYAKQHRPKPIVVETQANFVRSAANDPHYNKLYDKWVRKNYDIAYSPMITRIAYKGAYVLQNIKWVTKADVGMDDLQAQRNLMEQKSEIIEQIADMAIRYGISSQPELRSWLKRMPTLYSSSTLDDTVKKVETVFKQKQYLSYEGKIL